MNEFTAEAFDRIIRDLKSSGTREELRRHPRVGITRRLQIKMLGEAQSKAETCVWLRDLSASGIGILSRRPLKPGVHFLIKLPSDEEKPVALLCTVVQSQRVADRLWSIGCTLQRLSSEELSRFAAPAIADSVASAQPKIDGPAIDGNPELVERIRSAILS